MIRTRRPSEKIILGACALMAMVGLVGVMVADEYVGEAAALLLVGLGLILHRVTWGQSAPEDRS